MKEARNRNIYVVTSTNAHFISEQKAEEIVTSGLSEIIISIDGMTQETYEKYRVEGQLSKVLEGSKNLVAAKKKLGASNPIITFQFLVVRYNEDQIDRLHQLANEIGVDRVTLKTVQIYDFENGNDLIPSNEKYARYRKNKDGKYELKNRFKNRCWRMWSSCVFTWDGRIVPCCFDKDATHQLGELKAADDFQLHLEVWHLSGIPKKVMQNRQQIDICKNCSEGSKVWI